MRLCIPVMADSGRASRVSPHFGSAPLFMIVDTESDACRAVANHNHHHDHGMCTPLASLSDERLDGVVVGGIGPGALAKLDAAGIPVFLTEHPTVDETVTAFRNGALKAMRRDMACSHGGHR